MVKRAALFYFMTCVCAVAEPLPSVPGEVNPAVTQENLNSTACVPRWTGTVRPPASYTNKLKKEQLPPGTPLNTFEEDHRVPLALGGHPTSPNNLWPQHWSPPCGAHEKDRLEDAVHRDLCAGKLTLAEARATFLGDFWVEYDKRYKGSCSHR